MDIFDLVESLSDRRAHPNLPSRHTNLPPHHPNHPSQRQSPQVLASDLDDSYARHHHIASRRMGSISSPSVNRPFVSSASTSNRSIPTVNVGIYGENAPPSSRRRYINDSDSTLYPQYRQSSSISRGSSPERNDLSDVHNVYSPAIDSSRYGMPSLSMPQAMRMRNGSEPDLLHAGRRARSGSQSSEMVQLPDGLLPEHGRRKSPDRGYHLGGANAGNHHLPSTGPRGHRRTSSQSNVNDLETPVAPVPIAPRPPEKDRKQTKIGNLFRFGQRKRDIEVSFPTETQRSWPNEGLDPEVVHMNNEQHFSRPIQRDLAEPYQSKTMLRKRHSMVWVEPLVLNGQGTGSSTELDGLQDRMATRSPLAQAGSMDTASRSNTNYHNDMTDPMIVNGKPQEKQYCIRIYRQDDTFSTVTCGLNTTTAELCQIIARKNFMTDTSRFVMIVKRHNIERVLGAHEHPAYLQKLWLEQAGYTDADNISDHGREDNSYLFQFVFREQSPQVTLPVADDLDTNPAKSRYFDFQARNLPSIPKAFFRYAPNIITLNLSRNHGFSLPVEFAQQCTELRELRLANNDYKYVPEAVRHLASLTHLDLSCNRIEELDHAQLDQVKPLNSLLLQNNRLTDLPPSFGQFVSLTALYLSNNRFDHVPRVICEIRSLVTLDLSFNNISTIPDEIGQLTKLQRLLLVSNRISGTLPKTFDRLVELRELDLRQNSIQDLGVLSSMSRLKMLFLDYNTVSTLTCEFRQLQQLTLHKNHLTSFKPSSVPTTSLVSLNLSKSKLAQLPDAMFEQLPMLETLILDDNKFVSVPASICSLKQLNYLSCANNLLTSLPAEIYQLEYLSRLDVHGNNLAWLPQEIWYCQRLSTLNCSSNLLKTFPDPPAPGQKPPPSLGSGTLGIGATLSNNVSSVSLSSSISNSSTLVNVRHNSSSTPPLATAMRHLLLGDNGLTDDVFSPLAHFIDLRTLNLSFNDIYDIPAGGLYNHSRLTHLYLSGNQITSLPAEEIGRLRNLRELFVNGNKLHSLPAELGKIVRLQVLDVGSNVLKYNICNWPFDWNWNWNRDLKYLNLSNNKRLEIKENRQDMTTHQRNLADFSTLQHLRVLGLMDLTLMATPPEELPDRRVRTTCSVVNNMAYGMADTLGRSDMLCAWDLVIPKFRGRPNECLFALFDGRMGSKSGGSRGCKITKELSDRFPRFFEQELQKLRENETIETAMKRAFLNVNRAIGASNVAEARTGATALVVYIVDKVLYAANVGDALAVLARQRCDALPLTMKHTPWLPEEIKRIQAAGGFVSHQGLVNDELEVSRSFGHFHLVPIINANPYISKTELTDDDEFVIMASKGFWNWMSYQTAVDVARTESEDMMLAAQKLRDFAISYGADESIMIMVIRVGDLFRAPSFKEMSLTSHHVGQQSLAMTAATGDIRSGVKKNRRIKENLPGDSTLRRLQEEVEAPKGQVALVFTDIKNSTFLWDTLPRAMQSAIKTHNEIMRRYLRNIGGYEVKTEGDAFMVCFPSVASALLWCLTVQLQLLQADWPQEILDAEDGKEIYWIGENGERELIYRGLSVRMGIHWGMPVCEEDPITRRMDYFGPMVNRSARISGVADGGQICVSQDVVNEVEEISKLIDTDEELELPQQNLRRQAIALHRLGFVFINIGERKLKGLETAETLSLTYPQALRHRWDYTQRQLQAKASIRTMPEPSALPILDPDTVRRLGFLCLRLERITSGTIIPPKRKSRIDHLNGLLTFHVKDNVDDEELLRITENLVTRIQNAVSTLYLNRISAYTEMLETYTRALNTDTGSLLAALRECLERPSRPALAAPRPQPFWPNQLSITFPDQSEGENDDN